MHEIILFSSFLFFSIRVDLLVSMIELIVFWDSRLIFMKFSSFTDAAMRYSFLSVALLKFLSAELTTTPAAVMSKSTYNIYKSLHLLIRFELVKGMHSTKIF